MKNKDISILIAAIKKLKLPISPKSRLEVLNIISEIDNIHKLLESLKKSYMTEEFIKNEQEKYDYVKSKESDSGTLIFGINISDKDITHVVEFIAEKNKHPDYAAFIEFDKYMSEPVVLNFNIPIDYIFEEDLLALTDEELEVLTEIII